MHKKISGVLKKVWHDPVWSKVIAAAMLAVSSTPSARVSSPEGVSEKTSFPVPLAGTANIQRSHRVQSSNVGSPESPASVVPAGTATAQPSYRVQSPDVSRAARDVHIKYAAAESSSPEGVSEKTSAPGSVVTAGTATAQTSYRIQSPNVTDVHGNVDIEYGFSEGGGSKEKSAVGKK